MTQRDVTLQRELEVTAPELRQALDEKGIDGVLGEAAGAKDVHH